MMRTLGTLAILVFLSLSIFAQENAGQAKSIPVCALLAQNDSLSTDTFTLEGIVHHHWDEHHYYTLEDKGCEIEVLAWRPYCVMLPPRTEKNQNAPETMGIYSGKKVRMMGRMTNGGAVFPLAQSVELLD